MKHHKQEPFWVGIIRSMGIVFGDIGTSPIYTLTVVFALTPRTEASVLGILSLVVWTLLILVTVEYAWLAMSLPYKGQGGEIMLREILRKTIKPSRQLTFAGFLTFVGVSLLLGDGVITPAITLLSAVEGMLLIPGLENLQPEILILIAAVIAVGLFSFQSRGTDRVAGVFGPVMLVWFLSLAITGLASVATMPGILKSVSPWYAFQFLKENGLAGFFVLSEVILCATGGEALYADMGHLGKKPILRAWYFVFAALLFNYMGQGIFALQHPDTKYLLFGMVRHQSALSLHPLPGPYGPGNDHRLAVDHQRGLFGCLPGYYHPDHAPAEGFLHLQPDEGPDLHPLRQLGADVRRHLHDAEFRKIGESRRGLRHGGHRFDDDHEPDDDPGVFPHPEGALEAPHRRRGQFHRLCLFYRHPEQDPPWRLLVADPGSNPLHRRSSSGRRVSSVCTTPCVRWN